MCSRCSLLGFVLLFMLNHLESEGYRESIPEQGHVITTHLRLITKFEYSLGALGRAVPQLALCHGERVRYTVNSFVERHLMLSKINMA
jgi:hypothetical protein